MDKEMLLLSKSGVAECRICKLNFVPSEPGDRAAHKKMHKDLARGGMPLVVRELLKAFGWAVAHNDGGIDRLKGSYDPEIGKLAVAYSWWSRARTNGCPDSDFDAYMAAHLKYIDALTANDNSAIKSTGDGIKRWEAFAG